MTYHGANDMIDDRVGRAILRFVEQHRGRANYREIRINLTASLNVPSELVIWNEVLELINEDKFLDNGGVTPPEDDFEVNPESISQNDTADEKVPQEQIDDALLDVLEQFAPEMVTAEERARRTKQNPQKK